MTSTHWVTGKRRLFLLGILCPVAVFSQTTHISKHIPPPPENTGGYGEKITQWETSYTPATQQLGFSATMSSDAVGDDGFWMVLSDGPNPGGILNQLAILYGDASNGTITAYQYNGENDNLSWTNPDAHLGNYHGALQVNAAGNGLSFDINVASINEIDLGPDWEGIGFGEAIGIWYHPMGSATYGYDSSGKITSLSQTNSGWFDGKNFTTQSIPEPSTALLGAILASACFFRRNR